MKLLYPTWILYNLYECHYKSKQKRKQPKSLINNNKTYCTYQVPGLRVFCPKEKKVHGHLRHLVDSREDSTYHPWPRNILKQYLRWVEMLISLVLFWTPQDWTCVAMLLKGGDYHGSISVLISPPREAISLWGQRRGLPIIQGQGGGNGEG